MEFSFQLVRVQETGSYHFSGSNLALGLSFYRSFPPRKGWDNGVSVVIKITDVCAQNLPDTHSRLVCVSQKQKQLCNPPCRSLHADPRSGYFALPLLLKFTLNFVRKYGDLA